MPTPESLYEGDLLGKIEVELDDDEQALRLMYCVPRVNVWLDDVLPSLETDGYIPGALRPEEQADAIFYGYSDNHVEMTS